MLAELPGWQLCDNKLVREFKFKDFVSAFGFMSMAAAISEKLNHHPEWLNVYNRVTVRMWSHDQNAVTDRDYDWARQVNRLYDEYFSAD